MAEIAGAGARWHRLAGAQKLHRTARQCEQLDNGEEAARRNNQTAALCNMSNAPRSSVIAEWSRRAEMLAVCIRAIHRTGDSLVVVFLSAAALWITGQSRAERQQHGPQGTK
jgi:hypothetical protein